ncbi:MAG: NAD(P)H-dependent oxidoreductase [Gammaproteobacteria bacterium]|nr:NAD(P)H-dependent oxidoreductase [Gammaproteobacteria bacterium]
MISIVGISGSLRRHSFNSGLLLAAGELLPENASLRIESIADIPIYNADEESANGAPASVSALQDTISQADALIISTPEYNHSIPGVLKNAIDWLSRPPSARPRVFGDRPVAMMGTAPGRFGTALAQNALLPVLHSLGMRCWDGRMLLPGARDLFDDEGRLHDEEIRQLLKTFVADFVQFVEG